MTHYLSKDQFLEISSLSKEGNKSYEIYMILTKGEDPIPQGLAAIIATEVVDTPENIAEIFSKYELMPIECKDLSPQDAVMELLNLTAKKQGVDDFMQVKNAAGITLEQAILDAMSKAGGIHCEVTLRLNVKPTKGEDEVLGPDIFLEDLAQALDNAELTSADGVRAYTVTNVVGTNIDDSLQETAVTKFVPDTA